MKRWFGSLLNAAISGAVTGVASSQIFHGTLKQNLASAGIAALTSASKWYMQHQPPGVINGQSGQ